MPSPKDKPVWTFYFWVTLWGGLAALCGGGYYRYAPYLKARYHRWLTQRLGLTLDRVQVIGRHKTSPQSLKKILETLHIYRGAPTLDLPLEALFKALQELPWVARPVVIRKIPDQLHIILQEKRSIGLWGGKEFVAGIPPFHGFIDSQGGLVPGDPEPGSQTKMIWCFGDFAPQNFPSLLATLRHYPKIFNLIHKAHYINQRRWNLYTHQGVLIKLPYSHLLEALYNLEIFLKNYDIQTFLSLDMRFGKEVLVKKRHGI